MSTTLIAAGQHAFVVLMLVVYTVIVGREVGLSDAALQGFVALEIVVMGVATVLQGLPNRFGSGHLVVHNPSTVSIETFIAVAASFGIGAVAGAYLLSGIIVIVLSRFLPKLQTVFPPEVTGVLLVILGFSLVEGGIKRFTGLDGGSVSLSSLAKVKHWMRMAQQRTIETTWRRLGSALSTITPEECTNYFKNAGYASLKI